MKIRLHIAVFLTAFITTVILLVATGASSAVAGGPADFLCTRYNVGQVVAWSDGHYYRCRVYYTGNYGQYPHWGWIDLGIPA